MREARAKGIPMLGVGLIYPLPEEDIKVPPFSPPDDWPRGFAMDVGWSRTAAGWFCRNPQSKVVTLYDFHYQGREEPAIHAEAIKARGAWIPGVIDPRSDGRSQIDGKQLFKMYTKDYGLDLTKADNAVAAGIAKVWEMLVSGMLKVCENIAPFWKEFRTYHTDENGEPVKKNDHFCDLVRYFVMSGIERMRAKNELANQMESHAQALLGEHGGRRSGSTWMSG